MNRILLLLFLLHWGVYCSGQTVRKVAAVKTKCCWGYIDDKGTFVVEPRFSRAYGVGATGHAMITAWRNKLDLSAEEYGVISINRPTEPPIFIGSEFKVPSISKLMYADGFFLLKYGTGMNYFDTLGKALFPHTYDDARPFDGGLGTAGARGLCYLVRTNGTDTLILESRCREIFGFKEGFAPFKANSGRYGFVDTTGAIRITPIFQKVGAFHGGVAWVRDENNKIGYINTKGKWVHHPQFDVGQDMDPVSGLVRVKIDSKGWFFVDTTGKELNLYGPETIGEYREGLCWGKYSGICGFLDAQGKWAITAQYDAVRHFKNGLAAAKKGRYWGYIDQKGNWVIEPQFVDAKDFELIME